MANTLKFGNGQWATKEGSTLAYNSENNNYKPLPFTFDRDSVATRVNKQGLIETVGADQPRIDYLNDSNGALKLEPSRTNYQPYSNNLSVWGVVDVTVNSSYGLSPDGLNNSTLITEGTGSAQHRIVKGSPASSGIYTFSCFVRNKVGNRQAYIDMGAVTGFFNFDTKTMYSAAGTTNVESWSNDWYRISITSNSNITPSANYIGIGKNNTETFQGDGSSAIEFFAPQLEQGSYATSYIPTSGSAVTRLADVCSQTVPDGVIGQTEGTLFLEVAALTNTPSNDYITISDGTNNNFVGISFYTGTNRIIIDYIGGGVPVYSAQTLSDITLFNKIAINYNGTSLKVFINGNNVFSSSVNSFNASLNTLLFSYPTTYNNFIGKTNQIQVFTEALSDEELQKLTTI